MDILLLQPDIHQIITTLPDADKIIWTNKLKETLNKEFRIGWVAQKNGDIKGALKHYKTVARLGHKGSRFHLYCMYVCGQDVPVIFVKALKWKYPTFTFEQEEFDFLLSFYMEQSDQREIQNNIGCLFNEYNDFSSSFKWHKLSADQGYGPGLYNLGYWYYEKKNDYQEAMRLYELSAHAGTDHAMCGIGNLYCEGLGVPQNYEKAYQWYYKAKYNPEVQNRLGLMYHTGKFVDQNHNLANEQFLLAASQGYRVAQHNLAQSYENGTGVPHDLTQAILWYTLAADRGYKSSQYNLYLIYVIQKDYQKAIYYAKLAGRPSKNDAGHSRAQFQVGFLYDKGLGVHVNHQKALKWYRRAAEQGHDVAQNNLGVAYHDGLGTPINYEEARKWFQLASDQGFKLSQHHLGDSYEHGKGVQISYSEAYKWYKLASQTEPMSRNKITYFDDIKKQIQSTTKSYIDTRSSGPIHYVFFADLMKHLFDRFGQQPWQDPLIKSWLNEVLLEYNCDSLDTWLDALL